MKRTLTFLLIISMIIPVLNSCKKGENDPFISLKSRDKRVEQKWKLVSSRLVQVESALPISETATSTFDGSTLTTEYASDPTKNTSASGSFEMTLDKNGTFTYNETYAELGSTPIIRSGSSYWNWINSSKNKAEIFIGGGEDMFKDGNYVIDKLSSKEMVLKFFYSSTANGYTRSYDCSYTFEKQ